MDDASLCQLIREALHDPKKAEALAFAIDQLPEVKRYLGQGWMPYYDEALPMTERDVKRNINKFSPMYRLNLEAVNYQNSSEAANVRASFIKWVMMILKRDCQDVKRRRDKQRAPVSTSETIGGEDSLTIEETLADDLTLSGIKLILERERRSLARQMKCYIEEDPEMRLRNCHPRNNSNLDCQLLSVGFRECCRIWRFVRIQIGRLVGYHRHFLQCRN